MRRVPGGVAEGPDKGGAPVGGPLEVVEDLGVPDDFEHDLACPDWVACGTGTAGFECSGFCFGCVLVNSSAFKRRLGIRGNTWIAHMRHMIRAIKILAVPARREPNACHDALLALLRRERHRLGLPLRPRVHANVRELSEACGFGEGARVDVAYEHAEALFITPDNPFCQH